MRPPVNCPALCRQALPFKGFTFKKYQHRHMVAKTSILCMHIGTRLTTCISGLVYKTEFPSGHKIQALQACRHHQGFNPPKHCSMPLFPLGNSFPKAGIIHFFVLAYAHSYLWRYVCAEKEKTSWQLVWKNTFSFSLLNRSFKIIPKANILCYYWKIVAPGFQIQCYHFEKKFQTATKNIASPSRVSFTHACKSNNGENENHPEVSFLYVMLFSFFSKASKRFNKFNNLKKGVAYNYYSIKEIYFTLYGLKFWHHSWLQYHTQLETPRRVRTTRAIKRVTTQGEGKKCWKWRLFRVSIGNCAAQWVQNMFFSLPPQPPPPALLLMTYTHILWPKSQRKRVCSFRFIALTNGIALNNILIL